MINSDERQAMVSVWINAIRLWFPRLHSQTYIIPPVFMQRVPYSTEYIAGQKIKMVRPGMSKTAMTSTSDKFTPFKEARSYPVLDSDIRDNRAMMLVRNSLQKVAAAQNETMIVITDLDYCNYLNKMSACPFPRPRDLELRLRRGVFSVLIIHKRYGLLLGEIKSVNGDQNPSREYDFNSPVVRRVSKAIMQLNKAHLVISHLVGDLEPDLLIRKTLILPYVTRSHLQQILQNNSQLKQELCKCLQASEEADLLELCLLKDNLKSLPMLQQWWQQRLADPGPNSVLTDIFYEHLVARFCGPATTLDVYTRLPLRMELRTLSEGVSETGHRISHITLTSDQVSLLQDLPARVYLTGPPATGKTILLTLSALTWLGKGYDVHVVNMWRESRCANWMVVKQLEMTLKDSTSSTGPSSSVAGRLHHWNLQFGESEFGLSKECLEKTVKDIINRSSGDKKICIISNAATPHLQRDYRPLQDFCTILTESLPEVCLWMAGTNPMAKPSCLQEKKFQLATRCPPVVVNEINELSYNKRGVPTYCNNPTQLMAPTEGPDIIRLVHSSVQPGHSDSSPQNCLLCTKEVIRILKDLISDSAWSSSDSAASSSNILDAIKINPTSPNTTSNKYTTPPPLQYRDILILFGNRISPSSVLEKCLADHKIPFQVFGQTHQLDVCSTPHVERSLGKSLTTSGHAENDCPGVLEARELAYAYKDLVSVAYGQSVYGLERKVVVWFDGDEIKSDDKLHALSQCTAQLVLVEREQDKLITTVEVK